MPGPTSEEQGVMRATSALSITLRAQSLQSGLTLCNLMDCSPPGSSVRRILQARILELLIIDVLNSWSDHSKTSAVSESDSDACLVCSVFFCLSMPCNFLLKAGCGDSGERS